MRLRPLVSAALAALLFLAAVPARATDLANGEMLVRNICASCHGFPPTNGPDRAAGQPNVIRNALNTVLAMSFLRPILTNNDIEDIAAYLLVLQTGTPPPPPPPPVEPDSYQGLWLRYPYEAESGWGINFTHQGTTLFATWFTYDTDGSGMWLVMSNGNQTTPNHFSGDLYRTTAPGAFNSVPFVSIGASNYTLVGTLSLAFSDANTAEMTYTVNGVTQTKNIARYIYVQNYPTCKLGGTPGETPNYGALWWNSPAGSESGWGVNITHQGDILFGTWFTYQAGGKGMWLVMAGGLKTANNSYTGILQRTTGPAFSATPFNPALVTRTTVGDATFTFSDADNGTFRYTVDGVTQTKAITRLVYASPVTICK
jgi:cytochrome c553